MFLYLDCFDPSLKDVVNLLYALGKYAHNLLNTYLGGTLCAELIMNIRSLNSHKCAK